MYGRMAYDIRAYPVCVILRRPAGNEQTNREQNRAWEHGWQPVLWPTDSTVLLREVLVEPVEHAGIQLRGTGEAYTERDVVQTGDTDRLAVHTLEDPVNGGQEEVESAVEKGHVHAEKHDDRLAEEQLERPDESPSYDRLPATARVVSKFSTWSTCTTTHCLSALSKTVRTSRLSAFSGSMFFRIFSALRSSRIGAKATGRDQSTVNTRVNRQGRTFSQED